MYGTRHLRGQTGATPRVTSPSASEFCDHRALSVTFEWRLIRRMLNDREPSAILAGALTKALDADDGVMSLQSDSDPALDALQGWPSVAR
jgi:hypothetical protein